MALAKNSIGAAILAIVLSATFREGRKNFFLVIYNLCFSFYLLQLFRNFYLFFTGRSIRCCVCNSISNNDCENNLSNIEPIDCKNGNVPGFDPSKSLVPNGKNS